MGLTGHTDLYRLWARYALGKRSSWVVQGTAVALALAVLAGDPLRWAPLPSWVGADDLSGLLLYIAAFSVLLLKRVEALRRGRWSGRARPLADGGRVWSRGVLSRVTDAVAAAALASAGAFLAFNAAWANEAGDVFRAGLSVAMAGGAVLGATAAGRAIFRNGECLRIDASGVEAPGRLSRRVLWDDVRGLFSGEQGVELIFHSDDARRAALIDPDDGRPKTPDAVGMNWPAQDRPEERAASWIIPFDEAGLSAKEGLALIAQLRPELAEARRRATAVLNFSEPEPAALTSACAPRAGNPPPPARATGPR